MNQPAIQFYLSQSAKDGGVKFTAPRVGDAGFDLPCAERVEVEPNSTKLISTGLHLAIPLGWVGLIRDRSSVGSKGGLSLAGVVDASYRGEVKVAFHNLSADKKVFEVGDRVAQIIFVQHLTGEHGFVECSDLEQLGQTSRGAAGFGSTGS